MPFRSREVTSVQFKYIVVTLGEIHVRIVGLTFGTAEKRGN
jgi:hypothetical protein